jgi:hypothetical protein
MTKSRWIFCQNRRIFLAPKKIIRQTCIFFSNRSVCIYNGNTIRDKTAGYKNKECVFMLDFFERLYYNSIERS